MWCKSALLYKAVVVRLWGRPQWWETEPLQTGMLTTRKLGFKLLGMFISVEKIWFIFCREDKPKGICDDYYFFFSEIPLWFSFFCFACMQNIGCDLFLSFWSWACQKRTSELCLRRLILEAGKQLMWRAKRGFQNYHRINFFVCMYIR